MRLIHTGHGRVSTVEEAPPRGDPTMAIPSRPQRLRVRLKPLVHPVPVIKSHTNYKSGSVFDLGKDQCAEIVCDENGLRCGAKITRGTCCAVHAAKNYRGKA